MNCCSLRTWLEKEENNSYGRSTIDLKDTLDACIADTGLVLDHLELGCFIMYHLHTGDDSSLLVTLGPALVPNVENFVDAKPAGSQVEQAAPYLHPAPRRVKDLPLA